jgi:hypothetical protein
MMPTFIISTVTMNVVDASTSLLTFFHADDAAIDAGHVNTTINTMVLLKVPHHFGPFIHYLTIHCCYFSSLLLRYISAPTQRGPLYPATYLMFLIQFSYLPSPSQINYIVHRSQSPQLGITQPLQHVSLMAPTACMTSAALAWLNCQFPLLLFGPAITITIIYHQFLLLLLLQKINTTVLPSASVSPHATVGAVSYSAPSSILDGALTILVQPSCNRWSKLLPHCTTFPCYPTHDPPFILLVFLVIM